MKITNYIIRISLVALFNICFLPASIIACDCIPTSEKFIDNVAKRQLVLHAKVIEHTSYKNNNYSIYGFSGITKLSIIHSFKGKLWTDTLIHINTSPNLCGSSIQHLKPNQEIFLKAYLIEEFNTFKEHGIFENKNSSKSDTIISEICKKYQNIRTADCDVSKISVIDGKAKGRITSNTNIDQTKSIRQMYAIIDRKIRANR